MPTPRAARALILSIVVVLAGCSTAAEATPWQPLGAATPIGEPALARSAGGTLHVVFRRTAAGNSEELVHVSLSSGGVRSAAVVIFATQGQVVSDPALVLDGAGLRVFWAGLQSGGDEPRRGIASASSIDGGASWSVDPAHVDQQGGGPAVGSWGATSVAAANFDGATTLVWDAGGAIWLQHGLAPTQTPVSISLAGQDAVEPAIIGFANNKIMVVWSTVRDGLYMQLVDASTGALMGAPIPVPGSVGTPGNYLSMGNQTPLASYSVLAGLRVMYPVGWPSTNEVRMWGAGYDQITGLPLVTPAAESMHLPTVKGPKQLVATDMTSKGQWAAYTTSQNVYVVSMLGYQSIQHELYCDPATRIAMPPGASQINRLALSASAGSADIVVTTNDGKAWLAHVLPSMSTEAPTAIPWVAGPTTVRVSTTSGGAPVRGALVTSGSARALTNRKGVALIRVAHLVVGHTLKITIARRGFKPATELVKIRRAGTKALHPPSPIRRPIRLH